MEQPHKAHIFMNGRGPAVPPNAPAWMLARLLIFAAIFAMGGFLWVAGSSDFPLAARVAATVGAVICLALPVRVFCIGARRYYRTGTWAISLEDRTAWRERYIGRPPRPWVSLACTAALALMVLLNTISTGIRIYRHHLSAVDGLLFVFWLIFLAVQITQLYRELRRPSLASSSN